MCFSAGGSFALAGVLIGAGGISLARNPLPPYRMLAATPLLFGAQQAAEGIVWLTMDTPTHAFLHDAAVFAFLAFALIVWPTWVPVAMRRVETNPGRRRMLTALCVGGCIVSATAAVLLLLWHPAARIDGNSITYEYARAESNITHLILLLAYATVAVGPFFVSTMPLSRLIGFTLVVSVILAAVIRREALTSVWCFFAAVLSALVVVAIDRARPRVSRSSSTAITAPTGL